MGTPQNKTHATLDSFRARRELKVGAQTYAYMSLKAAQKNGLGDLSRLPVSIRILLENLLRHEDGAIVRKRDIAALAKWKPKRRTAREIAFRPARVLMQDFTGVPAIVDLAAMRDALVKMGGRAEDVMPSIPVDLVIDHSVMVDRFGKTGALAYNTRREFERNAERYAFLRWGALAFANLRVVPPGTGICHQVNLEYLARCVWTDEGVAYPDTLVGTDSHTTMINALGVLGWGVGGIEAEAAMLGEAISMLVPDVVGVRLKGKLREGATATDLVLTITEKLRALGVVGKFVEFFGPGLNALPLEDRATIANMSPEYGATCGFFPPDAETMTYLHATGRAKADVALTEAYLRAQGLWRTARTPEPSFSATLEINLRDIRPSLAGPRRPQDRVEMDRLAEQLEGFLSKEVGLSSEDKNRRHKVPRRNYDLGHGDVVIAAITSCTNTSNPRVMLGAGLLARNAVKKGLAVKPWVKTSLAPGSQVVADYLAKSGLQKHLDTLGFNIVGYGCTTCIGNSGPLDEKITQTITENNLTVAGVLSGNRNFEGRIHAHVRANYLASPMLVLAYALAGSARIDLATEPLGTDKKGKPVFLRDIWPSNEDITRARARALSPALFRRRYADVFTGTPDWRRIPKTGGISYDWKEASTYIRHPPFFDDMAPAPPAPVDIKNARILGLFGDSITTDHISPAGAIAPASPAADYLTAHKVPLAEFNSYGARRGNHEVMLRGTFGNIRIRNQMLDGREGGFTRNAAGAVVPIYAAARDYARQNIPLVVFAGREYGTGSSRDWAAKGTRFLGVRAVIARSFERIHRTNLIGMGVLPLQFDENVSWETLSLTGSETVSVLGLDAGLRPRARISAEIRAANGKAARIGLLLRIDTAHEATYYTHGGILNYVLRRLAHSENTALMPR